MSILDHFVAIAPYFSQLIMEDCHFTIADTEKFIVSLPGKTLKMAIKVGDPLREGSLTAVALKEKRRIIKEGNKQLYGIAHMAVCTPLIDNGIVIGCISIGYSKEKDEEILQLSQSLEAMVEQMAIGAQSFASSSQELAATNEKLSNMSITMREQMNSISELTNFVNQVATETNLLGLNAAIQAAHAGEHGKGFSVVAGEIRKLADRSSVSAKSIKIQLIDIQKLVQQILQDIEVSNSFTQEQAAGSEQIAASIEELHQLAKTLSGISNYSAV